MENERCWSIMTRTRKGVVSILRDLTEAECRKAYERLNPRYGQTVAIYEHPKDDRSLSHWYGGGMSDDNEIVQREVFGPPSWGGSTAGWDEWPKYQNVPLSSPLHPAYKRNAKDAPSRRITVDSARWTG